MMVKESWSTLELSQVQIQLWIIGGATVCTTTGTTTEGNLADYFTTNNLEYTVVGVANDAAAKIKFVNEECTAWTGDMSNMVAQQYGVNQDGNASFSMAIMPELLSKEPLGAATRDNDDDWNDVVQWVWFGMLTAEEMEVTSANYGTQNLSNPSYNRLLNSTLDLVQRLTLYQQLGCKTS